MEELARLTLGEVLRRQARRRPDAPALLSEAGSMSWAQLDAEVDRVAGVLHAAGVGPGEAVGFLLTKRPEVVTGFLALARLGAIMAPINFKLHPDQLRDQLRTADIRSVLVERSFDELLRQLLPGLTDPRRVIYVGPPGPLGEGHLAAETAPAPPRPVSPAEPCYYNYTSGTTGRPKGAVATHRNILLNALTAFDRPGVDGLGFTEDDVFLGMFSVFAHPHEPLHRSLLCGGAFVIADSLSPRVIAETIQRFGVSWMMAVPSFYEMLQDHVDGDRFDLSSLRMLESGGAWVSPGTLSRMEQTFNASFMPVWGSTETTGVAVALRPDRPRVPGTTGRPIAGYSVKVVDQRGRELPPGEVGEMVVQGEAVVSAYINNPEESAALFREDGYHTGDLVSWTEEGFLRFVARRSEMLKIGGIRVYPLEIERVVKDHPEVRDVVVVRAEERIRGEIARAVVTTVAGSTLGVRSLQRYCRARMAPYKVPRIVEFWDEIPKLPNGKIDKKAVIARPPDPKRDLR